jgi:alpha-glucoside transport system permease protein
MSGSTVLLADGTLSDFGSKFWEVFQALVIFLGVLGVIFFAAGRAVGRISRPLTITVFLGPAILLILLGLVIPAVRTIYLSGKNSDSTKGVGFDNYTWAFINDDIQRILINTLLWIVIAPVVTTVLGLTVALMVDRLRGQAIYKSLIFMPMAISFVGASIIWKFVYEARDPAQPQIGVLSQVAIALGWSHPPNWLLSAPLNTFLLMVIMVWTQTGFAMVVLAAAIRGIPDDIIEAARVDGARGRKLLFRVTIPMIRSTLVVVLTTIMIMTLKIFDIVRTMTNGNFKTDVLANKMYSQSFVEFNNGRGSALAVILFVAVLPLVGYNIVQLRRERAVR